MASPPSHSQAVLPNTQILVLDRIERDETGFLLEVRTSQLPRCPDCAKISHSLHSRYHRRLQDLPWQGLSVRLRLKVRRFRCRNPECPRKVFTERLPEVALPYARHTCRLADIVSLIGFVVGGLPGSRVLERLAISVSDDTILRRVKRRVPSNNIDEPIRSVGVDDWAWRKGQTYGTILVDLERHRVADLLPGRSADELAGWLKQHPTVEIISRDRSGLYAEGGQSGAPNATQVADRFHLVLNLSTAIERAFEERRSQLQLRANEDSADEQLKRNNASPSQPTRQEARKQQRRQHRLERYEKVVQLYGEGYSQRAISQMLQLERKTVRRWLRAGQFPERKRALRKRAKVHEFSDYLRKRWSEGCHNATLLYEEIRRLGYPGRRGMVAQFVSGWRKRGSQRSTRSSRIAPRHAAVLVTKPADRLTEEQESILNRLSATCPELPGMRALALEFRTALASNNGYEMRWWIQNAKQCGIGPLVRFAFGLQKDLPAV